MQEGFMKIVGLILGVVFFLGLLLVSPSEIFSEQALNVLAVVVLMLTWWVFEAVPIPVTATLPVILFPLLDIMTLKEATNSYGHYLVFLFFGGFVIALAMEKWNLHKRISIAILRKTGTHADGIIAGFMLATAFLSMWISNTATTVMMIPIVSSVLTLTMGDMKSKNERYFALSLMLAVAYSANIGGIATLIGTPTNAVMAGFIHDTYDVEIDFLSWLKIGLPFSVLMLILCWFVLTKLVYPNKLGYLRDADGVIESEWQKLGKIGRGEMLVLIIFILTALLTMFKRYLPFAISDTAIFLSAALILFALPVDNGRVLVWEDMVKLPWGILILLGGGLSIAAAMSKSGLVEIIGQNLTHLSIYGDIILLVSVALIALFITEIMSNVALVSVLLPVLGAMSLGLGKDPLFFAIPVTLVASCAFMLPMSTPPNALVFSSGHIRIAEMMKAGVILNIIALLVVTLFTLTLVKYLFNII